MRLHHRLLHDGERDRVLSNDREVVIVTEIPYMVNKAMLLEKIADLVRSGIIAGIPDSATT